MLIFKYFCSVFGLEEVLWKEIWEVPRKDHERYAMGVLKRVLLVNG